MLDVNSRPIYLRELDGKDNDSVASSSIEREQKIEAIERRLSELLQELERRGEAPE